MTTLFWLLVAWGVVSLLERLARTYRDPKRLAGLLEDTFRALYVADQEYVPARLDDFPHVDRVFYETVRGEAEACGFRFLGDIENRTVSAVGLGMPTPIRIMTDDNGIGIAAFDYRSRRLLRLPFDAPKRSMVTTLGTEFSTGDLVTTSTAWTARHLERPPSIRATYHPAGTHLHVLLEQHKRSIADFVQAHVGASPLMVGTLADAIEANRRADKVRADFRRSKNFRASREELRGFAGDNKNPVAARDGAERLADALDGASPRAPASKLGRDIVLWLGLVVFFVIVYSWMTAGKGRPN